MSDTYVQFRDKTSKVEFGISIYIIILLGILLGVHSPSISLPEIPEISLPEMNFPSVPKIELPYFPEISLPELPGLPNPTDVSSLPEMPKLLFITFDSLPKLPVLPNLPETPSLVQALEGLNSVKLSTVNLYITTKDNLVYAGTYMWKALENIMYVVKVEDIKFESIENGDVNLKENQAKVKDYAEQYDTIEIEKEALPISSEETFINEHILESVDGEEASEVNINIVEEEVNEKHDTEIDNKIGEIEGSTVEDEAFIISYPHVTENDVAEEHIPIIIEEETLDIVESIDDDLIKSVDTNLEINTDQMYAETGIVNSEDEAILLDDQQHTENLLTTETLSTILEKVAFTAIAINEINDDLETKTENTHEEISSIDIVDSPNTVNTPNENIVVDPNDRNFENMVVSSENTIEEKVLIQNEQDEPLAEFVPRTDKEMSVVNEECVGNDITEVKKEAIDIANEKTDSHSKDPFIANSNDEALFEEIVINDENQESSRDSIIQFTDTSEFIENINEVPVIAGGKSNMNMEEVVIGKNENIDEILIQSDIAEPSEDTISKSTDNYDINSEGNDVLRSIDDIEHEFVGNIVDTPEDKLATIVKKDTTQNVNFNDPIMKNDDQLHRTENMS